MECMRIAAARTVAARFLKKEGAAHVRCGLPQACLPALPRGRGKQHYHVMTTASDQMICPMPMPLLSRRAFSTEAIPADRKKGKKSPHSKLLRVCSDRNANPHFAAIEAELLRLNWKESIDALVKDWTQKRRWGDFIELERNVRSYVNKNLVDLKFDHPRIVDQWEQSDELKTSSVTLSDHVHRVHYFPHEAIITSAVHHALAGENILSLEEMRELGGNMNKITSAELRERISVLSKAGDLLDAMASFEDADSDSNQSPGESTNDKEVWTVHHTSCSKCYQSVVAGWFLLHRRLREANQKMISESSAGDIIEATIKLDIHPEHEAYVWTKKWINFCTSSLEVEGEEAQNNEGFMRRKVLLGGITSSDKPLLMGVAKMLSMTDNEKRQDQSAELDEQLDILFRDDE